LKDPLAQLRAAREQHVVAWTLFLQAYGRNPSGLYCFFEGEDAKYYGVRIRTITGHDFSPFRCGGVDGVLAVWSLAQRKYPTGRICFFIDHDYFGHPEAHGRDRLYMTPTYSVENLYADEATFRRVLDEEIGFSPDQLSVRDQILDLYRGQLNAVNNALLDLNAWLRAQKRVGSAVRPGKLKLSSIVHVDLTTTTKNYCLDDLTTRFPEAKSLTDSEIICDRDYIRDAPTERGRGKFLAQFIARFLRLLGEELSGGAKGLFGIKKAVPLQSGKNVLSELSQYACTPPCLHAFLKDQVARWSELDLTR